MNQTFQYLKVQAYSAFHGLTPPSRLNTMKEDGRILYVEKPKDLRHFRLSHADRGIIMPFEFDEETEDAIMAIANDKSRWRWDWTAGAPSISLEERNVSWHDDSRKTIQRCFVTLRNHFDIALGNRTLIKSNFFRVNWYHPQKYHDHEASMVYVLKGEETLCQSLDPDAPPVKIPARHLFIVEDVPHMAPKPPKEADLWKREEADRVHFTLTL